MARLFPQFKPGMTQTQYVAADDTGSLIQIVIASAGMTVQSEENWARGCDFSAQGSVYRLQANNSINFSDVKSKYEYNQASSGGVMSCQNCEVVQLVQCEYNENRASDGGIFKFTNARSITDIGSIYTQNQALQGAIYKCEGCNITVDRVNYSDNQCETGCIFHSSMPLLNLSMSSSLVKNNYALQQASFAYVADELNLPRLNDEPFWFNVSNSTFEGNYASLGKSGLLYSSHPNLNIVFQETSFDQNFLFNYKNDSTIDAKSSHFYLYQAQTFVLDTCTFNGYNSTILNLILNQRGSGTLQPLLQNLYLVLFAEYKTEIIIQNCLQEMRTSYQNVYYGTTERHFQEREEILGVIGLQALGGTLTLKNNTFRNNYLLYHGPIFVESGFLSDMESKYYDNAAIYGGAYYIKDSTNSQIESVLVKNNMGQFGGALYLVDSTGLKIESSTFKWNQAMLHGGTLMIQRENLARMETTIEIYNSDILDSISQFDGGSIYLENDGVQLILSNCNIKNTSSLFSAGGFALINKARLVQISSSTIINSKALDAQIMKIQTGSSISYQVKIQKSIFECSESPKSNEFEIIRDLSNSLYSYTSAIIVKSAQQFNLSENTFMNCLHSNIGGVFLLYDSNLTDYSSEYYFNSALQGGVIRASGSKIVIQNSIFRQNYAQEGAVIMVDNNSILKVSKIVAEKNYATVVGGAIQVLTYSSLEITGSVFNENYASQASCLNILQPSKVSHEGFQFLQVRKNQILSTKFQLNTAEENTIQIMYGYNFTIQECNFLKNKASKISKNIFIGFSNISIDNTNFEDSLVSEAKKLSSQIEGSFLHIITKVYLNISNSNFINGYSQMGGALYLSGSSSVNIDSSVFQNNYASEKGGAIYINRFQDFQIKAKSIFKDNFARIEGSDIYALQSEQNVSLSNVKIQDSTGLSKNQIYLESVRFSAMSLSIISKIFQITSDIELIKQQSQNTFYSKGGSIYCKDCFSFYMTDVTIQDSRAQQGGALALEQTAVTKDLQIDKTLFYYKVYNKTFIKCVQIHNSFFSGNQAAEGSGGAIYIDNVKRMLITRTHFSQNQALKNGGALILICEEKTFDCRLELQGSFTQNRAGESGGAIYWGQVEPIINGGNTTKFDRNEAAIYANDIGSIPAKLVSLNETQYQDQMKRASSTKNTRGRRLLQNSTSKEMPAGNQTAQQEGVKSGGALKPMYVALADKYGQVVGTSSNSKLQIQIDESYKKDQNASQYQPNVAGVTSFYSEKGVFKIENIQITGSPGSNYKLKFVTDAIDINKPSNKEILEEQKKKRNNTTNSSSSKLSDSPVQSSLSSNDDIDFQLDLKVRQCQPGERFTESGQCIECPANTSFSLVTMDKPGECQKCPTDQALCFGGSFIGPKPGFWRKSNTSYNFIKCVYPYACLGIIPPDFKPTGECFTGYNGILCADCNPGYSRTGQFECQKCPEQFLNALRISGIIILFGVLLIFMIRSTLNGAHEKRNITSVFQKILLNHIQLVSLTASFNFKWPSSVNEFFKINEPVGEITQQAFSVDCFAADYLKSNEYQKETSHLFRIFYIKLVMIIVLPIVMMILTFVAWRTIYYHKKFSSNKMQTKAISTIVILLFFIHPNIVKQVFQTFYCLDIDGEQRLKQDVQIECYKGPHKFWSYGVAIPGMIIWGFGIPLFGLALLLREKEKIEKLEVRQKLGFLFRGYTLKYFYWEIVIMFRKIVLILIQSFLVQYGVLLQALVVFVLLILFMILTMTLHPFQTLVLNKLEVMSLLASMITVYCGIFYIVEIQTTDSESGTTSSTSGIKLDDSTKFLFFLVILFSNFAFILYWTFMVYFELKSMLIKKFTKIYLWLCLCGNSFKLGQLRGQIDIQEENEILREKYVEILNSLEGLNARGELVLNQRNLEKVSLHLEGSKVLKAAGSGPGLLKGAAAQRRKLERRVRRKYITQNEKKRALQREIEAREDGIDRFEIVSEEKPEKQLEIDMISDNFQIDESQNTQPQQDSNSINQGYSFNTYGTSTNANLPTETKSVHQEKQLMNIQESIQTIQNDQCPPPILTSSLEEELEELEFYYDQHFDLQSQPAKKVISNKIYPQDYLQQQQTLKRDQLKRQVSEMRELLRKKNHDRGGVEVRERKSRKVEKIAEKVKKRRRYELERSKNSKFRQHRNIIGQIDTSILKIEEFGEEEMKEGDILGRDLGIKKQNSKKEVINFSFLESNSQSKKDDVEEIIRSEERYQVDTERDLL